MDPDSGGLARGRRALSPPGRSPSGCGTRCRTAASRRCRAVCATSSARVPGQRARATWCVGAHYDTKDIPGFVGANDGAGGHRAWRSSWRAHLAPAPRTRQRSFALFDGEESPDGTPDRVRAQGLRGTQGGGRRATRAASAMILLDFVADRDLRDPARGQLGRGAVAEAARAPRAAVGAAATFPPERTGRDPRRPHAVPAGAACPSIDLIDFDYPCWHRPCDDLLARLASAAWTRAARPCRSLLARL